MRGGNANQLRKDISFYQDRASERKKFGLASLGEPDGRMFAAMKPKGRSQIHRIQSDLPLPIYTQTTTTGITVRNPIPETLPH